MAVPLVTVRAPVDGLYRIARGPDEPFALPDWDRAGEDGTFGNRFDDPGELLNIPREERFRVLYCATQRQAAFGETTARFRQVPELIARLARIEDDEESIDLTLQGAVDPDYHAHGLLEHDWLQRRRIGHTRLDPTGQFVDISHANSLAHLNEVLTPIREMQKIAQIDLSAISGQSRRLTQYVSRYIYTSGFSGIRYSSRLGDNWECWALFEGRFRHEMGYPSLPLNIFPDDADLLAVARSFGLTIESVRAMGHFLRPWQDQD